MNNGLNSTNDSIIADLLAKFKAAQNTQHGHTKEVAESMCKVINENAPMDIERFKISEPMVVNLAAYWDDYDKRIDPEYDGSVVPEGAENQFDVAVRLISSETDRIMLLAEIENEYKIDITEMIKNMKNQNDALTPALNEIKSMDFATALNESRIDANQYSDILFAYKGMTCGVGKPELVTKEDYLKNNPDQAYRFQSDDTETYFFTVNVQEYKADVDDEVDGNYLTLLYMDNIPLQDFENRYGKSLSQLNKEVKEKLEKYGEDILRIPLSKYANEWLNIHYTNVLVGKSLCYEIECFNEGFSRVDEVVSVSPVDGKDILYVEITNLNTGQGMSVELSAFAEDFDFTCSHIDLNLSEQIVMQLFAMDEAFDYNAENEAL